MNVVNVTRARHSMWIAAICLALAGCSGEENEYDALFSASSATPNTGTVFGVWESKSDNTGPADWRVRFTPNSIMIASHCVSDDRKSSKIIGFTVPAEVTEQHLVIKEHGEASEYIASDFKCTIYAEPGERNVEIVDGSLTMGVGESEDHWHKVAD